MTVEAIPDQAVTQFLEARGFREASISELKTGRNSRVYKVSSVNNCAILKIYHKHANDSRDRLASEYAFLSLLNHLGVFPVAKPLGKDEYLGFGIYEYLLGAHVSAVTDSDVNQAVSFLREINDVRYQPQAKTIHEASEACWSLDSHIFMVKQRVTKLRKEIQEKEEPEAFNFVNNQLSQALERSICVSRQNLDDVDRFKDTPTRLRILSPSDFGFHNVLKYDEKIYFVDFEYAGWDDPVKLVCDFICQPDVPVSDYQSEFFTNAMANWLKDERLSEYVDRILLLYRVKWCCILLNNFLAEGDARRKHANAHSNEGKKSQLEKAKRYFSKFIGEL